ncbi:MAG TPA: FimV/HubP family polar landmark protein [Burkholderiaceae bacterium]|nr:FimV/HubP family polar landmark protein [Burkholderiaceae bacterium]
MKYRSGPAARVALSSVALAALVTASGSAWALGLGRLNVQSALGEALRAEIDISSLSPDEESSLKVRVAPPESYRASGVDYNAVLTSTQVTIARRPDGRPYLRVTSERAVQEPFVDVILELTWSSGRLVREFTLLLDPPQARMAPPVQATAPTAPQVSAAPQVAPTPAPSAVTAAPIPPQAAAPSARPAPAARGTVQSSASQQAALPTGPGDYKVREGDTLYRIAKNNQRAGVSLDQMLVALFRSNPNAFMGDNMNRLKAGAVLSVPSSDDAKTVTTAEAKEVIRAQSADFGAYRARLAGNVPTTKAEESRQAKGKVEAAVDDRKQATAPTSDKLTLSQGAVKAGSSKEAKVSKDAEKKAAEERAAELAKNIEQLKDVQKGARADSKTATAPAQPAPAAPAAPVAPPAAPPVEAKAPAPATPPPAPETPPPTTVAQAPVEPSKAEAPAAPALPLPAPAASEPAAAPPAAAAASVPPPRPTASPKPTTPPVEEPSMLAALMDHPMAMPGAIGLVVLLVGLALYRLRGRFRKDNGETSFLESRLQPDSFFGASGGQRVDTRDASGVSSSMSYSLSQLDAIGDVDPVAEADVYLAYGRDLQAEEILKEAMRGNPDRLAIRTKLLEVYAKRRDTKGFELLATQLYSLTKGEGDDWSKAQELGRGIDPENPLYKPGGQPVAAVAGDGGRIIEPLGASTMPQSIMPSTSGFPPSAVDSTSHDTRGGGTIPPDLDLDLDLGTMPSQATKARPQAKPQARPASVELDAISLDLGAPSAPAPLSSGTAAKPTLDFGDFTLPAQPSGHGALDENDPLARKLELAEEFRQIGDMEGARDLLEEVVAKAGGALKTKAQSMLDSLA